MFPIFSKCIQHLWGWAWSIYKFYHESICYLICYKRKSVLILTMVFNLFAPMRAIYMFVSVQFVFPVCFCCYAPCFIGLILLQRTWMMICDENTFTCMFSPKIRKKCSNMVMLLTSVYEYGWMPNISSGILKLSPVASVSLHFTWNVYHWTPRNSPIFYSMNIHGTAHHVFWNFFHLTKLKMIECLLWKLITMTLKPD